MSIATVRRDACAESGALPRFRQAVTEKFGGNMTFRCNTGTAPGGQNEPNEPVSTGGRSVVVHGRPPGAPCLGFFLPRAMSDHDPLMVPSPVNLAIFIGGMPMEPMPVLLIATPIIVQVAPIHDLDIRHVGVGCVVDPMLGTPTPPFAIVLFTVLEVARVPFLALVRGALPRYLSLPATIVPIMLWPAPATHLPTPLFGSWTR